MNPLVNINILNGSSYGQSERLPGKNANVTNANDKNENDKNANVTNANFAFVTVFYDTNANFKKVKEENCEEL